MEECEVCAMPITPKNKVTGHCPECDRQRCETCDAGKGTICIICEDGE